MVWISLALLAVALSMDAVAVSAARALGSSSASRVRDAVWMGVSFGVAQGAMPVLGYVLGARVGAAFAAWDHWIASVLLVVLGIKMIREALSDDDAEHAPLSVRELVVLALATSIDALAAGVTLPLLGLPLLASALGIGLVTGVLSFGAAWFSRALAQRFGERFAPRLEVLGGVVLVALGLKVLLEHFSG